MHLLKVNWKKLQKFDSNLFICQSYFSNDESQNLSLFQPIYKTFTTLSGLPNIIDDWLVYGWIDVWMSNSRIRLEFKWSHLKQDNATSTPDKVVNLFIVYDLGTWSQDLNTDFTLKDSLFRSVKLTKNVDPYEYKYSGYSIGFEFSWF